MIEAQIFLKVYLTKVLEKCTLASVVSRNYSNNNMIFTF